MELNDIRSLVTLTSFLLFIGLVARVWRHRARRGHEQAAQLVFQGEADGQASASDHKEIHHV